MSSQLQLVERENEAMRSHIQGVRLFMRDFAELNLLIQGEESSDRMIQWATYDFLSDFNGTPPFSGQNLSSLHAYSLQSFAIRGTVISLLQSLILLYTRNHLNYSDGGISASVNDKAPMLQSILGMMQGAHEQNKRMIKTSLNINSMFDAQASGLHSDYFVLGATGIL